MSQIGKLPSPSPDLRNHIFFFGLFALIAVLAFIIIEPYLDIVFVALITVIALKPLYDRLYTRGWLKNRQRSATAATIFIFILLIAIPIVLLVYFTYTQAVAFLTGIPTKYEEIGGFSGILDALDELLSGNPLTVGVNFDPEALWQDMLIFAQSILQSLVNLAISLGASIPSVLASVFIFLAILVTVLPNYENLVGRLREILPLNPEVSQLYIRRVTAMVTSILKGVLIISVIQGSVQGVFYALAGVPYTWFFTFLSIAFSILPVVGISFIVLPIGIGLLLSGNTVGGLIVLGGFYGVTIHIDNILRPRLISHEAYLGLALILLSFFGGMAVFGVSGLILGPVIMILLVTTINVYQEYYMGPESSTENGSEKGQVAELVQEKNGEILYPQKEEE